MSQQSSVLPSSIERNSAFLFDLDGTLVDSVYQHVLVECETPNVYLVLVLDVPGRSVAGHHLLDLNRIYGLT